MLDPTSMSPGSLMPRYPWLFTNDLNTSLTQAKLEAMVGLGVPYDQKNTWLMPWIIFNAQAEEISQLSLKLSLMMWKSLQMRRS